MKEGRTLSSLAAELERRSKAKRDFVVDTRQMEAVASQGTEADQQKWAGNKAQIRVNGNGQFPITEHTHNQIGERTGIPAKYYDRMVTEAPDLWARNVNHWFQSKPERRMVRTLDGNARAFLSDRYRRLDNDLIAEASLPVLMESADIQIVSAEVTERKLYLKAVFPKVQAEVKRGDIVQAGVVISNSEIGLGGVNVSPLIYRLVCLNGLIVEDAKFSRYHVGRRVQGEEDVTVFRDATMQADDKAFVLKLQDVIRAASAQTFTAAVERMTAATQGIAIAKPVQAVEVLGNILNLGRGERESVLERLIRGGDYSRYGALNAITNLANDTVDYDRATDLEALGGRVLELPANDWKTIAEAA